MSSVLNNIKDMDETDKKILNEDLIGIFSQAYIKVLYINLKTQKHTDLFLKNNDATSYADNIGKWLFDFADNDNVFEGDREYFKENTDIDFLRAYFEKNNDPFRIKYRRLQNGQYVWAEMVIIKSSGYTAENPMVMLYVMDMGKFVTDSEVETRQNRIISALSKRFFCIYRVDMAKKQAYIVNAPAYVLNILGDKGEMSDMLKKVEAYLVHESFLKIMHEFHDYSKWNERLNNKEYISQEFKGTNRWTRSVIIVSKRDEEENVTEVLYAVQDIEEQKILEEENNLRLREALEQAKEASQAKSRFLSNMSHDIRTPMNAIVGFTDLAYENLSNKELVKEYLSEISSAGRHLVSLINDVLEMSHIESGKMEINPKECNITEILDKVFNIMNVNIKEKNLKIDLDVKNITHKDILCDEVKLNQILFNLLGNAVKYNKEGGSILLSCAEKSSNTPGESVYEFIVKDTGIGMSETFLNRIFDTFEREEESITNGVQGTGLGMPITKALVELMGGGIIIESEKNKGTTCYISIPFTWVIKEEKGTLDKKEEAKAHAEAVRGIRILLAEDNLVNQKLAGAIFKKLGVDLEIAVNGKEALEILNEKGPGYYKLVIMDMQMPIMDGLEATRAIRKLDKIKDIPIIMATANVFEEDRIKSKEAGANGFISKPIDVDELLKEMCKFI